MQMVARVWWLRLAGFLALVLVSLSSVALHPKRDEWINPFLQRLDRYLADRPESLVFVHTNQTSFGPGETLWFAIHQTLGSEGLPDTLNRLVHVELRSPMDTTILKLKVRTSQGRGRGQIDLPSTLGSGTYQLVAYTAYQRNFNDSLLFRLPLQIWRTRRDVRGVWTRSPLANNQEQLHATLEIPFAKEGSRAKLLRWQRSRWVVEGQAMIDSNRRIDQTWTIAQTNQPQTFALEWEDSGGFQRLQWTVPANTQLPRLRLLPEGGDLVAGVENRIALESTDAWGLPLALQGRLMVQGPNDPQASIISEIQTDEHGRGWAMLTPLPDHIYFVQLEEGERVALPSAQALGVGLSVSNRDSVFRIQVRPSSALARQWIGKELLVIVMQRNAVVHASALPAREAWSSFSLPVQKLKPGVAQVTVVGPDEKPYAERLIYCQHQLPELQAELRGDLFQQRKPLELELAALLDGSPIRGSVSVSVESADVPFVANTHSSIGTYLRLGHSLTVPIPDLEFSNRQWLDWLLVAKGWRRFTWRDYQSNKPMQYPIELGLQISGQVTQDNGKPYANKTLLLMGLGGKEPLTEIGMTTDRGMFAFPNLSFTDTLVMVLKPDQFKAANPPKFLLDTLPSLTQALRIQKPIPPGPLPTNVVSYLQTGKMRRVAAGEYEMDEVGIVSSRIRKPTRSQQFGKIYSDAAVSYSISQKDWPQTGATPWDVILRRLPGVNVTPGINPTVTVRGVGSLTGSSSALLVVDNVPLSDWSALSSINPLDVDHIDLLSGPLAAVYGTQGANGVVAIYTKQGGGVRNVDQRLLRFRMVGLHAARVYAQQEYQANRPVKDIGTDLRSTLAWWPSVDLDGNGKAQLRFWQDDEARDLRIRINGLSTTGQPLQLERTWRTKTSR